MSYASSSTAAPPVSTVRTNPSAPASAYREKAVRLEMHWRKIARRYADKLKPVTLMLISLAFTGCVAPSPSSHSDGNSPNMFYASQQQADDALMAYQDAHPNCQLWTNWQKMCSRMGGHGEIVCVIDTVRRVRPSTPFCAGRIRTRENVVPTAPFGAPVENENEPALHSSNRFCVDSHVRTRGYEKGIGFCGPHGQYRHNRPFSAPFWQMERSPHRIVTVPVRGQATIFGDYTSSIRQLASWCNWPTRYDSAPNCEGMLRSEMTAFNCEPNIISRFNRHPVVGEFCEIR